MKYQFENVGIWGRFSETSVAEPALRIADHLRERGVPLCFPAQPGLPEAFARLGDRPPEELPEHVDVIITVGGDGTMLHAARRAARHKVPLLGVNLGRLGFLTDIPVDGMLETIDGILAGEYRAEERVMLEAWIARNGQLEAPMLALNDVVLEKCQSGRMLDFITWVDEDYVNFHGGDGLIVATPTGSTAYALSCGGPIIQPDTDALVMVPVCPHTLSDRPLVIQASSTVEVRVEPGQSNRASVSCDGEELGKIGDDDVLRIRKARDTVRLLHPRDYNYYEVLRTKLNWGRGNRSRRTTTSNGGKC